VNSSSFPFCPLSCVVEADFSSSTPLRAGAHVSPVTRGQVLFFYPPPARGSQHPHLFTCVEGSLLEKITSPPPLPLTEERARSPLSVSSIFPSNASFFFLAHVQRRRPLFLLFPFYPSCIECGSSFIPFFHAHFFGPRKDTRIPLFPSQQAREREKTSFPLLPPPFPP